MRGVRGARAGSSSIGRRPATPGAGSSMVIAAIAVAYACRPAPSTTRAEAEPHVATRTSVPLDADVNAEMDAESAVDASVRKEQGPRIVGLSDPMKNHHDDKNELLALFTIKEIPERDKKTIMPD